MEIFDCEFCIHLLDLTRRSCETIGSLAGIEPAALRFRSCNLTNLLSWSTELLSPVVEL
jgi:hypothetical protein